MRKTVLPETFTDKIFQESKSGQMQQTLIPTNSLTSISSVLDSLVRHFQLLEKGQDSTIPEVYYFLKSQKLHEPNDHSIYCLKTSKAFSISKMGRLLEKSSESLMNYTMMSRSVIITLRTTYHKTGHVSSLSELLEPPEKVPEKYYLSDKMMQTLIDHKERHRKKGNGFGFRIIIDRANTLTSRYPYGSSSDLLKEPKANTISARYGKDGSENLIKEPNTLKPIITGRQGERVYDVNGISSSLLGSPGGFGRQTGMYAVPKKLKIVIPSKFQSRRVYDPIGIASALTCASGGWGAKSGLYAIPVLTPFREKKRQNGRRFKTDGEPAFTVTCQDQHGVFDGFRIRRLMPIECEKLQGMPPDWTKTGASGKEISDSQRYKCCGNAVSVPVVQHILERMLKNE